MHSPNACQTIIKTTNEHESLSSACMHVTLVYWPFKQIQKSQRQQTDVSNYGLTQTCCVDNSYTRKPQPPKGQT